MKIDGEPSTEHGNHMMMLSVKKEKKQKSRGFSSPTKKNCKHENNIQML